MISGQETMKQHVKPQQFVTGRKTVRRPVEKMGREAPAKLASPAIALAMLLPLAAMTGCAGFSKDHFTVGNVHHTYKTRHPIVIDEREQVLDLPVASGSFDLPRAQAGSLSGFVDRYKSSASGVITVMVPAGSPNAGAAHAIGSKIVYAIGGQGVPRRRIRMVSYDAAKHGAAAPIRLSFYGVKASVTGCGQWKEDLAATNVENQNYHNFGCASQSNTAAMIANPADLLGPRGMTEPDAERRNTVIDIYRTNGNAN